MLLSPTQTVLSQLNLVGPFNETHIESPAEPTCLSLHGQWSPPFVPVANQGFEIFIAPGEEKKYWRGQKPGDRVSFELQTSKGQMCVSHRSKACRSVLKKA